MKKIGLLILAICFGIQLSAEQVKVNVLAKSSKGGQMVLTVNYKNYTLSVGADKKATAELDIAKPTWGRFKYMGSSIVMDMLLIPGKDINIEFEVKDKYTGVAGRIGYPVTIHCDDGGVNEYLLKYQAEISKSQLAPFKKEDMANERDIVIKRFDEILQNKKNELNKLAISDEYKEKLLSYVEYSIANSYLEFAYVHIRSGENFDHGDTYYKKIERLIVDDPTSVYNEHCLNFIKDGLYIISSRNTKTKAELYTKAVKYASNLNTKVLRRILIWHYTFDCIQYFGIDGTEEMREIFKKTFADTPKVMEQYNSIVRPYLLTEKGMPSPTFDFKDVNGKLVSLESLKGKFVYIDLWATWCGPCKKEIPFLQKLEHDYADKDINFVSISTDYPKDVDKWKTMVKEKKLGGIQLHIGEDTKFVKAYNLQGIPRFILLDKEGKIVDANAPKPSSPEVRKMLNDLL